MDIVEIRYTRPPDRLTIFRQQLVRSDASCSVTLLEHAELKGPVRAGDRVVLEPGAPVVWFTFPGAWHDIGRFHLADGTFTGFYANVITPVEVRTPLLWSTTDLFLDVWLDDEGVMLLDEDELEQALQRGCVGSETADRARVEAETLMQQAVQGIWPPLICREITLERARSILRADGGTRDGSPV